MATNPTDTEPATIPTNTEPVSEGGQGRKRKRGDRLTLGNQNIVTVSIEHNDEPFRQFKIHKPLLCAYDTFLDFFDTEDEAKVMILYDVRPDEFEYFSAWLYTKELVIEEMEQALKGQTSNQTSNQISDEAGEPDENDTWYTSHSIINRVYSRLLDLYLFAGKYKILDFKIAVMLEFQRFEVRASLVPDSSTLQHLLPYIDDSSRMYQYLACCYVDLMPLQIETEELAKFPPRFLVQIVETAHRALAKEPFSSSYEDWCDYHEHEDDDQRKECESSRPNDIDIKNKKRKEHSWPDDDDKRKRRKSRS